MVHTHNIKTLPAAKPARGTLPILNRQVQARKTIIYCPIGLGNYIMVSPSLKRLSAEIGKENLHLLALKSGIRQMAEASDYFSRIFFWDPDSQKKTVGLATLAQIRREHYDFSLSLFPTSDWRFALFSLLTGAKTRIGFTYPNTDLPARVQAYSAALDYAAHDTDQNYELIEALIGTRDETPRELYFSIPPAHPNREALRRENYYVCHPGSSAQRGMKEKRLPPHAFAELSHRIYSEFGIKCLLVGGSEEKELREEIAALAPEAMLPYASRSLSELAALITQARFHVGNDSGLMHIAVALKKPCIAFFGPTDDRRAAPYDNAYRSGGKGNHLLLRRTDLECTPCWSIRTIGINPPCIHGDTRCLNDFPIAAVWPKIHRFIVEVVKAPAPRQPNGSAEEPGEALRSA